MKRWKFGPLLCVVVLAITMVAGDGRLFPGELREAKPRIIYVYKSSLGEIQFWSSVTQGIKAGVEEFGYAYSILGARDESDIEGNILAVQRAISLQPEVIVLAASDYQLLEPVARKVVDAGILLLTIDSDVAGGVSRCFIGTDNYSVGRQMGEELLKRIPDDSTVAVISHVRNSHTATQRIRGVADAVAEGGAARLLAPVYCDNRTSLAKEYTLSLMKENPDIAGFIATNELSAIGLSEGLVELGLQDQIAVITCDNASDQIAYLERGVIDATIVQRPFNMGYFSVQIADALLRNPKDAPDFYDTGCSVITIENYFTPENQKLLFPFWD